MITVNEVEITYQDSVHIVKTEKLRRYDLLVNESWLLYNCGMELIFYVLTWDSIVTKYHKSHLKRLQIPMCAEAYIQSIVLKKTRASMCVIMRAEMHEEPTPSLKEEKREEDGTTNNINEESDFEKETTVVKEVQENA
ncbi:hypothetical protein CWI36_0153p0040 [Hamiltosporidium magnivora]|uniref:Uncharacterized protein n=1 Tax=Hamiltosporidium magnivora TaxID=148818 RepID=A0A4Q9LKA2_9MICR|nr:hypothetical protein CWI36_0153p0040 [Hamiltosporidium magnivora]